MSEAKEEHRKDGFQKFWTKDKTEALLSLLEEQARVSAGLGQKINFA